MRLRFVHKPKHTYGPESVIHKNTRDDLETVKLQSAEDKPRDSYRETQ